MANVEATEAKIDALRGGLDEVKKDVRELRTDMSSLRDKVDDLRGEMHAGFNALRESIARVEKNLASLQGTMQTVFCGVGVGVVSMLGDHLLHRGQSPSLVRANRPARRISSCTEP